MSNKIALTQKALAEPKNLREMFELDPIRQNFVSNSIKTKGISESQAEMLFEREKILFLKAITPTVEKCDRLTIYTAFIELAVSGVSLNEGESFIIAYGKKAQFQMGYKGRLRQIQEIPAVHFVNMPQVVWSNDVFEYELGDSPKIIKHKPALKHDPATDELLAVYLIIDMVDGSKKTALMLAEDIYFIRDHYSKPYIQYINECKSKGKKIGESFKKTIRGKDGDFDVTIEPPMWITSPVEAFKKTIINRVYKWFPKNARQKALDEKISRNVDIEEGMSIEEDDSADIDYGVIDDSDTSVSSETIEPVILKQQSKPKENKVNVVESTTETVKPESSDLPNLDDIDI